MSKGLHAALIERAIFALMECDRDGDYPLIAELEALAAAPQQEAPGVREALELAVRQNSHDMLMTGEELRLCNAALTAAASTGAVVPAGLTQRGFLIEWPSAGGGSKTLWSDTDAAANAIGCPYEPVYAAAPADHVPVSPEEATAIDAALGLFELPPIRLGLAVGRKLKEDAAAKGLILQAHVRDLLTDAIAPQPSAPVEAPGWRVVKMHGGRDALMHPSGARFWWCDDIDSDHTPAPPPAEAVRVLTEAEWTDLAERHVRAVAAAWDEVTTHEKRIADVMQALCGGHRPSDEIVTAWLADPDDSSLQEFAIEHGPAWAQGIAVIDAARLLADQPTEGVEHHFAPQPEPRKALSAPEIERLWNDHLVPVFGKSGFNPVVFARAIESAHGISQPAAAQVSGDHFPDAGKKVSEAPAGAVDAGRAQP